MLAAATTITRFTPKLGTDSYAYYAQGTYQFSPEWSLTLGGRYTREKKTFNTKVGVTTFTTLSSNDTFKKFTPVGILKYQPRDDLNFYAKAGKAFKSGIINSSATTVLALKAVNPENLTQYEVGMKSDLSSSVRLNVAAYYTDYKDLQSTARDPATSTSLLQNAGGAEIYGVEAEAYWRPMDNLNIRLGVSALHGEYTDFPGAQVIIPVTSIDPIATANQCVLGTGVLVGGNRAPFCDATGNKIIRTPFFTASLGGDYTIPLDSGEVVISGNIYHQGKSYWDVGNRVVEPKKLLVNAQVAWKSASDKFGVTLWGENLTNETHRLTASISPFGDNQVIAKPRTYGIELTYGW